MIIGLMIILILVLFLPFLVKPVEHNLEIFLFVMGILAALISGMMNWELIKKALIDPINITLAVLIAGVLTRWAHRPLQKSILTMSRILSPRIFMALTMIILGIASSIITAIIAAIILVIIVNILPMNRTAKVRFTILACFAIGVGAVLTPIGEPLSTITVSKLNEDFFYLFELVGWDVILGLLLFAILSFILIKPSTSGDELKTNDQLESYKEIIIRSVKIYLFVMGLTFLGHGFEPLINEYILGLSPMLLYWINMISAILDNATLAAAEISPAMDGPTIQAILLGLLISGGMLIPGNIPNIIAAGKLNITSKEWARFGVPIGLIFMALYFVIMFLI